MKEIRHRSQYFGTLAAHMSGIDTNSTSEPHTSPTPSLGGRHPHARHLHRLQPVEAPDTQSLVDLGLTGYEASAYLPLTRRGQATGAEVARLAELPRQRV